MPRSAKPQSKKARKPKSAKSGKPKRGLSAYNMFVKDKMRGVTSGKRGKEERMGAVRDRMKEIGPAWSRVSGAVKKSYEAKAKSYNRAHKRGSQ
jgi:hypothetical protein